jgi:phosphomannomutase/phosphoglucomutase
VAIPQHVFREYDVRGRAADEITPELARLLGYVFGRRLRAAGRGQALVGRDNRRSSPALAAAVAEGLTAAGCDVVDLGLCVTPAFYFAREHLGCDAGVMVTASHNPGDENGFKLALGRGTLYGEEIAALGREVAALAAAGGLPEERPGRVTSADVGAAYLDAIVERVRLARPRRVVCDCGDGTASLFAPALLRRLGCEVVPLYCGNDPDFPHHHPDPARAENLRDLIARVRSERADLGLAFDGDGDRLGAVDGEGRILWGDQLMMLFWREILTRHPGAEALIEVKCSQALVEEVERLGGRPFFHRTGHSYIKATLYARNLLFAGEMSGHLFFHDEYYGFDDALYAGARLLRLVAAAGRSLAELAAELPHYPSTPEVRASCPDGAKFAVVAAVRDHFAARLPVVDVDGARILFPDGWGLVRASNTQPALVLRCEARSPEALRRICDEVASALARHPEVGPVDWGI